MVTKSVGFLKFGMEKRPGDVVVVWRRSAATIQSSCSFRGANRLCDEFTAMNEFTTISHYMSCSFKYSKTIAHHGWSHCLFVPVLYRRCSTQQASSCQHVGINSLRATKKEKRTEEWHGRPALQNFVTS